MAKVKLTKKNLREEQKRFFSLSNYLPTLQLKKKLLQFEITKIKNEKEQLERSFQKAYDEVLKFVSLFSNEDLPLDFVKNFNVQKYYENIAGIELPILEKIEFEKKQFGLFDTPIWFESSLKKIKKLIEINELKKIADEKLSSLTKELNEVSIRVNLFDKILIPRSIKNIKKIKLFLNDQELAAIAQAKVAKNKIIEMS